MNLYYSQDLARIEHAADEAASEVLLADQEEILTSMSAITAQGEEEYQNWIAEQIAANPDFTLTC